MRFHLHRRPLLLIALGVGFATGLALWLSGASRPMALLLGWCIGVLPYTVATFSVMLRATPASMQRWAERLDESEGTILAASTIGALASLGAVAWFMVGRSDAAGGAEAAIAVLTIMLSWTFIHLMFAVRYAHAYWQRGGGLSFPGEQEPEFIDFLYLAYTIGMTFQTSDVAFASRHMRHLALVHGLVSFVFNIVIIAAAVNVAAGVIG
jgi:uncharacterized membrane protein